MPKRKQPTDVIVDQVKRAWTDQLTQAERDAWLIAVGIHRAPSSNDSPKPTAD